MAIDIDNRFSNTTNVVLLLLAFLAAFGLICLAFVSSKLACSLIILGMCAATVWWVWFAFGSPPPSKDKGFSLSCTTALMLVYFDAAGYMYLALIIAPQWVLVLMIIIPIVVCVVGGVFLDLQEKRSSLPHE